MTAIPQKLGRYEVLEEIGKGAMGVVYLARDPLIGRLVALKTFRVGFAARDEELSQFRSRFVREAQSAGILSHPNIVTIHDVVDEGPAGVCFIAMEYVKGTNLKQLLQRPDPFPTGFVVEIIAQVAEALDYAHSRGVVHRDIKPANILITPENRVKITDFGIARMDSSNLTMEGQLLGTPNYMAPEQIQGREVDHRADIFSLGVVFYEMLTRKKPFQGENMTAVTHKIVYDAFQPPEEIVRDLPKGLSALLTRCLEKDPNRRFPRASEVARDIRAVIAAQQALDDTVATQEVEEVGQAPGTAPATGAVAAAVETAPQGGAPTSAEPLAGQSTTTQTPADLAPTRMIERPAIPSAPGAPPPAPQASPDTAVRENAPTQLIARPPMAENAPTELIARPPIQEFKATLASPPKPAPPIPPLPPAVPAGGVAETVLSPVPRTTKSAPPAPAANPPVAAGSTPASAPTADARPAAGSPSGAGKKSLLIAAAALVLVGLLGGAGLWLTRSPEKPTLPVEAAPAPALEQQIRVTAASAISEARTHLAAGNLDGALQAVARAELAEPQNAEALALREEIEARRQEIEASAKQAKIDEGLRAARYAYAERRYSDAIASAKAVLAIDGANAEARRISGEADRAIKRLRERQLAIEAAQQAPAPAPEPPPEVAPPAVDPALLSEAQLRIEFASERSEGVLTVYAGEKQILREAFKFVRRTGFLAREKTSGTILATRKVPVGPLALKVYVTLPGKATRAILLDRDFPGGQVQTLVIHVDDDGNAAAGFK